MPSEDSMAMWPRERDFKRPDVVIGTRDCSLLERFLLDWWMDPDLPETIRLRPVYRWHICI